MEHIYFPKINELKKNLAKLENELGVSIKIDGKMTEISGPGLEEYEAYMVLQAMAFGFSTKKALVLKSSDFQFKIIRIRDFTRKKNLKEVRARIIGTNGRTLKTIKNLSNSEIILNEEENEIGIIALAESMDETLLALQNLIRGTKQSNVYYFLEKQNRTKKDHELGLKNSKY